MKSLALFLVPAALWAAVDGTVVNQTSGQPQAGVEVSMMGMSQSGMEPLGSTKTGADGKFQFPKDLQGAALLQATWQGVSYSQVLTPGSPTTGLSVNVFDSTRNSAVSKVSQHLVLLEPSADKLGVSETYFLKNDSKTTLHDPANGTLRFALPPAAKGEVQVRATAPGGVPLDRAADKTGKPNIYKVDFAIKPGETRIDLVYSLPFTPGGEFENRRLMEAPPTRLVATPGVTLSGEGLKDLGQEPQTKAGIYESENAAYKVKIDGTGSLTAPATDSAQSEDEGEGLKPILPPVYDHRFLLVGLGLAILAVGFALLYRKGSAPAAQPAREKRRK